SGEKALAAKGAKKNREGRKENEIASEGLATWVLIYLRQCLHVGLSFGTQVSGGGIRPLCGRTDSVLVPGAAFFVEWPHRSLREHVRCLCTDPCAVLVLRFWRG